MVLVVSITPVMSVDPSGYFIVGVMIASISISLIIEAIQDKKADGDFDFGWNYIGAAVSGFFTGLSAGVTGLIGYSILGSSLDYFISGEYNYETFLSDMITIAIVSSLSVCIGQGFKFLSSSLKASYLKGLTNPIANSKLGSMGISTKIGSNIAKKGLNMVIHTSGKYFMGEVIENVSSIITQESLLLIFD